MHSFFGDAISGCIPIKDRTSVVPLLGQPPITIGFKFEPEVREYYNWTGNYDVTIQCHNCGDQTPIIEGFGSRNIADNNNAWQLEVKYEYYKEPE